MESTGMFGGSVQYQIDVGSGNISSRTLNHSATIEAAKLFLLQSIRSRGKIALFHAKGQSSESKYTLRALIRFTDRAIRDRFSESEHAAFNVVIKGAEPAFILILVALPHRGMLDPTTPYKPWNCHPATIDSSLFFTKSLRQSQRLTFTASRPAWLRAFKISESGKSSHHLTATRLFSGAPLPPQPRTIS